MLDRILLSRVFQSWTYQRLTASTRSRMSFAPSLSVRSIRCPIFLSVRYAITSSPTRAITSGRGIRVRLNPRSFQGVKIGNVVSTRQDRPRLNQVGRERLRLFDFSGKEVFVDRAMVDVLERHPFARQHTVQLDDPADQVGVRLLPERFFPLAEELIQEGRHGVGERVGVEPPGAQRIPGHAAGHAQFEVVSSRPTSASIRRMS